MINKMCFMFLVGVMVTSCAYENEEELFGDDNCSPGEVTFSADIQPIIQTNCALPGCHNGSNASIPNWSIFSTVQSSAQLIKFRTANRTMPPSGAGIQLTSDQIADIGCWVDDGALNN